MDNSGYSGYDVKASVSKAMVDVSRNARIPKSVAEGGREPIMCVQGSWVYLHDHAVSQGVVG